MTRAGANRSASDRGGPRASGRRRAPVGRPGRWVPFLVGAAVVLVASVLPVPGALVAPGPPAGGSGGSALGVLGPTGLFHLIGYAGLAVLAIRATGGSEGARGVGVPGVRGAAAASGASVVVGLCAEVLQAPLPWRSFAWGDAGVNAVGALLGVAGVSAVAALWRAAGEDGEPR